MSGQPWAPILFYHRVVPDVPRDDPFRNCISLATFESQLAWLARRGYSSIPLAALATLFNGRGEGQPLPRRPVVITFDDGYEDVYTHAWPVLARHRFTATVFLVSEAIGGHNDFDAAYVSVRVPMLSTAQIGELARHGTNFGSHSHSHPASLVGLPDDRLVDELERSRAVIEEIVSDAIEDFAYPHSKLDDRVAAAVAGAGYRLACAGIGTRFEPFCLHRLDGARAGPGAGIELAIWRRRLKWLVRRRLASRTTAKVPTSRRSSNF